jgi:ligand-binding sensor domain-containing protein/signal transduction histidine kinase
MGTPRTFFFCSLFSHLRKKPTVARWLLLFSICWFSVGRLAALDPSRHISQYGHTAWRTQDGVFGNMPRTVAQTTDGYLWFGTIAGLWRFDGVRFTPWTPPDGQKLLSPRINSLLGTPDGSLWIGTALGLSRWQNDHLTNYVNDQGVVTAIIQAQDGTIWIQKTPSTGDAGPLCQVTENGMQCHGKADGIPAGAYSGLVQDSEGNFWLGGDTTLVRWAHDSQTVYSLSALKMNEGGGGIMGLAADPDGSLWVGAPGLRAGLDLQHLARGVLKPFIAPQFHTSIVVQTLFLDRQKALWVGTSEGLYRIYAGQIEHFGSADGLSGDYVLHLLEDHEGNLWVVTSKGVDSFRDLSVTHFSAREGLTSEEVDSVLAAKDGGIWIGGSESLDLLRNDHITSIRTGHGLPGHLVTSLFEDHAGRLWVGVDDALTVYADGKFRRINRRDGTATGMIVGITEDVEHNIWVESRGSGKPLFRIQDFKIKEEFSAPQMPTARRVAANPGGGLWLGLMNGDLARYQGGRVETFHFQHAQDSRVEQVTVNPNGSVLGATAFGLIGWRNGRQLTLTMRNGLPCDSVYSFISDDHGNLWLYSQCGLVEIANADVKKWWDDTNIVLQPKVLDALDGAQTDYAPFQGAAKSSDGRLWFASGIALQTIDPNHVLANSIAPPVYVEEIIADRRSYAARAGLVLPALTRDLEIDYTALSFAAPQKVRFRYRLEGRDTGWQEPGTRRQAFYTDLRPGKYRFHVIARNNSGVWNEDGASLDFNIAPAWFQTSWFRVACTSAFLLLLWFVYQLRLRQLHHQFNIGLEARVKERTRIARDLHDTLLQSFHGLLLRLQTAANLLPTRPDDAKIKLDGAIDQASQAIAEGRDAVQSLRSSTIVTNDLAVAIRTLGEELAGVDSSEKAPVFEVAVEGDPKELRPIVRDEVYRITGEALRNAFRHAQATRIEVDIRYSSQDLRLRIRDNGKGIDAQLLGNQGRTGHFGLHGMRERAKLMGGNVELWSNVGSGTEIELTIPAANAYETHASRLSSWLSRKDA